MKIISATTETPGMTKEQVDMFLEGKFMLQMSTLDEKGVATNQITSGFWTKKNSE